MLKAASSVFLIAEMEKCFLKN